MSVIRRSACGAHDYQNAHLLAANSKSLGLHAKSLDMAGSVGLPRLAPFLANRATCSRP